MMRCRKRRLLGVVFVVLVSCVVLPAPGQPQTAQPPALQTIPEKPTSPPSAQPPGALPSPTQKYALSHDRYQKAVSYSRAQYALYFVSVLVGFAALLIVLRTGFAARVRDFAERLSERWYLQGAVFVPVLVVVLDLFDLPVRIYGHALSLHYEQSVQWWGSWLWDWSKAELLSIALYTILALLLFALMRKSPRRWWFYCWLAFTPIFLFLVFLAPIVFEPMFNKFEPLQTTHPELVAQIEKVVQRAGLHIPPNRMFLMHESEKGNQLNAYVSGFGASKRVVVWDTTIKKMTTDETLFVFGHEAGHYVLNHVRNAIIFGAVALLVALYLSYVGLRWALARWGRVWRIYGPSDWVSFVVILLVLQVVIFLASPVFNAFSRMQEHQADIYGLEVIHGIVPDSAEVAAHAFQVLGDTDLADPNPPAFITFWLYSHPPLADRLVFAHRYDPWAKGRQPRYVKSPPGQ